MKVMGGGGVKALFKVHEEEPKGAETHEGIGLGRV